MFAHTDIKQAPWYVVEADVKKRARLNCIKHFLSLVPYEDLTPEPIVLPPRTEGASYVRPAEGRSDPGAGSLQGDQGQVGWGDSWFRTATVPEDPANPVRRSAASLSGGAAYWS